MLTTGIQNLPEPLARAQAAYHDGTARLAPASADRLAWRVEHFASSVQFVPDDPDAARRLGRPSGDGPADLVGRAMVVLRSRLRRSRPSWRRAAA